MLRENLEFFGWLLAGFWENLEFLFCVFVWFVNLEFLFCVFHVFC